MERTRILIVDDSVTIRAMIETLLERDGRVSVVGIARNAEEAFDLIETTNPDVITLDVAMPGKDGLTMLDEIMHSAPRPIIMLSSLIREGEGIASDAIARGAAACFNKSLIVREAGRLIRMIKDVAASTQEMQPLAIAA